MAQEEYKFPDEQVVKIEKPAKEDKIEFEVEGESEGKPEIEVVDDTPPEDRGRKPMKEPPADVTEDELEQYSEGVKKRIQHFSKGYHEERRAKEAALKEREEALKLAQAIVEENRRLKGTLSEGRKTHHEKELKSTESAVEDLKIKVRDSLEAGDSNAVAYWNAQLMASQIKLDRLQNTPVEALQEPEIEVKLPTTSSPDPSTDPKLLAWQSKNQWFGANKRMTAYVLGLHDDLEREGIVLGSDEYWRRIDVDMKERFPEQYVADEVADAPKPQRQRTNVVAPATRSTAPKKIVLTKSQVNIAKRLGVPLDLYARKAAEAMRNENG